MAKDSPVYSCNDRFWFGIGEVMQGTVKWFSAAKGYGFIAPDGGGKDLFVHHSAIQMKGYKTMQEGDRVSFEAVKGSKGPQAEQVVVE